MQRAFHRPPSNVGRVYNTREVRGSTKSVVKSIRIGTSTCLLGERVRYDGRHKRHGYLVRTLARTVECVPICPEVAIGLGVPRPPIELVANAADVRALGVREPALDVTPRLRTHAARVTREFSDISGYVFKSGSPSCGLRDVRVRVPEGRARRGRGIFAAALMARRPLLPTADERQLDKPAARDSFLAQVFFYRRWQEFRAHRLTGARLRDFHRTHALSLMAHGVARDRTLVRLLLEAEAAPRGTLADRYAARFLALLRRSATRARHARVLTHAARLLAPELEPAEHAALRAAIAAFRRGQRPLSVPIALLARHLRRRPHAFLSKQVYLHPSPAERRLRYGHGTLSAQ